MYIYAYIYIQLCVCVCVCVHLCKKIQILETIATHLGKFEKGPKQSFNSCKLKILSYVFCEPLLVTVRIN